MRLYKTHIASISKSKLGNRTRDYRFMKNLKTLQIIQIISQRISAQFLEIRMTDLRMLQII